MAKGKNVPAEAPPPGGETPWGRAEMDELRLAAYARRCPPVSWSEYLADVDAALTKAPEQMRPSDKRRYDFLVKNKTRAVEYQAMQAAVQEKLWLDSYDENAWEAIAGNRTVFGGLYADKEAKAPRARAMRTAEYDDTPPHLPASATPAKHVSAEDVPPENAQIREIFAELEGKTLDLCGVDIASVLRNVLSRTPKADMVPKNAIEYLALHKCVLLSHGRPSAYASACSREQWQKLRESFKRRRLDMATAHGEKPLRALVEKWERAVDCGHKIYMPKRCGKLESAALLATCVQNLSLYLRPHDAEEVCEATWTLKFVAPYFALLANEDLNVAYDSTTVYSINRPDIHVRLGSDGRVVACVEVKRLWATRVEKDKDQARVISSAVHFMEMDKRTHELTSTPPARMAIWMAGDEIFVYEVLGYPDGMYVAFEIARFRIPVAMRADTVGVAAEAIGWFSAVMKRIEKLKRTMDADKAKSE
ncbi:hypothetical protein BDZ88DRAFT_454707 [Geranomyces variabilis]|nr:hypothetical protein BDZ88DRAFT_454707 [Geranomyces variabilis]KAJ3136098.1 hypothetical protein HDU90_003501 [Geranomyces variabilis]